MPFSASGGTKIDISGLTPIPDPLDPIPCHVLAPEQKLFFGRHVAQFARLFLKTVN